MSVNITQSDRDAAAAFAAQASGVNIDDPRIKACLAGEMDDSLTVQHFARYRRIVTAQIVAWMDVQPMTMGLGELLDAVERDSHLERAA